MNYVKARSRCPAIGWHRPLFLPPFPFCPSALPPFRPLTMYELLKDERVDNDVNVLECRDVNRMPRCWRITTGDLPWPAWWRAA